MASPVFTPGGQCSVRKPHNSTIPADAVLKLEIQMLSLPSTEAAQGADDAIAVYRRERTPRCRQDATP